ncbi:type I phosphomannose isomerase catalytic subunit [Borrelia miyamotoi]|uniref:type I phosphomannose isomerase catalytic subunit n=1 Tax=Borrelia miyamotoi TaxID=47466 RepID=UPI003BAB252A
MVFLFKVLSVQRSLSIQIYPLKYTVLKDCKLENEKGIFSLKKFEIEDVIDKVKIN